VELYDKARELGVELEAAVFPPSLAWLVGQNYREIMNFLSKVHVMLCHKCDGAACLNHEILSLYNIVRS